MYLSDIARKLRMRDKDLKQEIKALGYNLKPRVRTVDDDLGKEIIEKFQENSKHFQKEAETNQVKIENIAIGETIKVGEFAKKMGLPVSEIIKELMSNGILASINEEIDFETASIVADNHGIKTKLSINQDQQDKEKGIRLRLKEEVLKEGDKKTRNRPPIVTVMGHVDHGKTTLLDAIRETNVTSEESGGITQHIGAYQAKIKGNLITFLDTPGHEAFTAMRARGAKVTDVAILIVAADDGVKPQTKEALDLILKAGVPFIVAINKIDKPGANVERVKKELADLNAVPEEWGGKVVMVEISAKNKVNIEALLEMILLVAEMEDLRAVEDTEAVGTIIEQRKDAQKGAIATVLIQNGTLRIGDFTTVGNTTGTIKSMENFLGKKIDQAKPSTPVQVLGLNGQPEVGDILQVVTDKEKVKLKLSRLKKMQGGLKKANQEKKNQNLKKLNIILKADVQGSLEAIVNALTKIKSDRVALDIVDFGVGKITESDVMLASSSNAKILLFKTNPSAVAARLAREKKISIDEFSIIYELIDQIKVYLNELLEPEIIEKKIGRMEILAVFRTEKEKMIVGGEITDGKIRNNTKTIITRDDKQVGEGKIINLQSGKVDVKEVIKGNECGIVFSGTPRIKEGDILEIIEREEIKHTIS